MSDQELIDWAIRNKRVDILVKHKWGFELSPGQCNIVRKIAFMEVRKLSVCAMTRYGKSQCVAFGIALLIDFGIPAKIAFLGPKEEQAGILRQYLSELIVSDPSLLAKANLFATREEKIGKEASRKRMTFNTGAEYRVFSGEGDAGRLMGFGCDILIRDEACLISRAAYTKSSRMLGDNPEDSIIIELYNPWDTDNVAYEHTLDPKWEVIQIGWEQAVAEGRTTKGFVDQQRGDFMPLEFTVLYESKFPDQPEDSLFSLKWVTASEELTLKLDESLAKLLEEIRILKTQVTQMGEGQYRIKTKELKEELYKYTKIVACDPAEKGKDETVIYWGIKYINQFQVIGKYNEAKSDPMRVVGKCISIAEDFIEPEVNGKINIDRIGIGSGPLSRIKEVLREKKMTNVIAYGCHYGEKAMKSDIFQNKKAENWFSLADIMREGLIDIPVIKKLRTQLLSEKWERTSANKKKVVDPDDSPDWGDGLVYFVWRDKAGLLFGFG